MDDKKLLEFAAKAVGIEHPGGDHCIYGPALWDCKRLCWWRPLTDDGDAFRLAVQLEIQVSRISRDATRGIAPNAMDEALRPDPYAAARRAIVIAAAVVGESMP